MELRKKTYLRNVVMAAGLALGTLGAVGAAQAGAIISNGTLQMGVNDEGHLNTPYDPDPLGIGYMGLRYMPTGAASTEPGCQCEGWGIGIKSSGTSGYANVSSDGGAFNLSVVSFTSTASTAISVVDVTTNGLRVTHNYHPSAATPNLYQVDVTVQNNTGSDIAAGDLVYRRVMDWDIYPTPFSEMVTIQGVPGVLGFVASGGATNVLQTDNNGFNSANPFSFDSFGLHNVNFTDAGPSDHGALFDFDFAALANGASMSFTTYYGAAENAAAADAARALVGMNLYSYGKCSPSCDSTGTGAPNTFIFGFGTTSGGVLVPAIPEPETYAMLLAGLGLLGFMGRRRKQKAA